MRISKKTKILGTVNVVYLCIIAIEEAKIIELLPINPDVQTTIKTGVLALVTILNVIIAQLKFKP